MRRGNGAILDYRQMAVFQKSFQVSTRGHCDVLDITQKVARIVAESKISEGIVNISGRGSTLGITTLEFESGCVSDLRHALEKIAPANSEYAHNARWGDNNGYSHLRSALIGTAKSFPLATWHWAPGSRSCFATSTNAAASAKSP